MNSLNTSLTNKYQYLGFLSNSVRLKENERWGINDLDGNEILSLQYNEIITLSSGIGFIAAREGSFWKIYNLKGEIINSERYDSIYPYYGLFGITKIKNGDGFGLLNKKGRKIVPTIYKKIEKFGMGIVLHHFDSTKEFIERKQLLHLPEITNENNFELNPKEPIKKIIPIKVGNKSRSF